MKKNDSQKEKSDFEIFKAICDDVSAGATIKDACANNGRSKVWYFGYIAKNDKNKDVINLSTRARLNKAHSYFDDCENVLIELKEKKIDASTARVLFDGYLRLAGKANQGLYGDVNKTQLLDDEGKAINPFEVFYKKVCEEKDYTR